MGDKGSTSGESLILGATAWLWLLPFSCHYSGKSIDLLLANLFAISIPSGAIILAVFFLITSVLGIIGEKLSFVFIEKAILGQVSNPRPFISRRIKILQTLPTEDWHSAQERIWSSPQAFQEFTSAKMGQMLGRTMSLNAVFALFLFGWIHFFSIWLKHFNLMLVVSWLSLFFGLIAWFISTIFYRQIVIVAGEMEKKKKEKESVKPLRFSVRRSNV